MHFFGNLISNGEQKVGSLFKVRTPVSIRLRPDPVDCGPLASLSTFFHHKDSCPAHRHKHPFLGRGEDGIVAVNLHPPYDLVIWLLSI